MKGDGRLYRENNAVLGGVCAGIANYFEIDAILVRIMACILLPITSGVVIIFYAILYKMLPCKDSSEPFDITPQTARSEAYGVFDPSHVSRANSSRAAAASAAKSFANKRNQGMGVGHLPPSPPKL